MVDLLLANNSLEQCARIKAALKDLPELNLVSETKTEVETQAALVKCSSNRLRILVFRLALSGTTSFGFISKVRIDSNVYIVPVLEGTETGTVWETLLILGMMKHVILAAVPATEIANILRGAAKEAQRTCDPLTDLCAPYVISVVGVQGGQGKTMLATHLAAALARWTKGVLLLDFTLNPRGMTYFLDHIPQHNLVQAISGEIGPLKSRLNRHERLGFDYLVSPTDEKEVQAFDYNLVLDLFIESRLISNYTVVDTGAPKATVTIAAVDSSDVVFILTSRESSQLLSTGNYIKYLIEDRQLGARKLKLILFGDTKTSDISDVEVEALVNHPITAVIPASAGQVNLSIPIESMDPREPAVEVINKLAELCYHFWEEGGGSAPWKGPRKGGNDPQGSPVLKGGPSPSLSGVARKPFEKPS